MAASIQANIMNKSINTTIQDVQHHGVVSIAIQFSEILVGWYYLIARYFHKNGRIGLLFTTVQVQLNLISHTHKGECCLVLLCTAAQSL